MRSALEPLPRARLPSDALSRPELFVGMHFFNPVRLMALVELIRGLQTSDEAHARALAFAKGIGKTPITVKNGPGFAVNRILCPMINEAIFALQEGMATAEDIDTGMKLGCNHPIGPLALADMVGLDTLLAVMQVFYEAFNDPKYRPAPLLKEWSPPVASVARATAGSTSTAERDARPRPPSDLREGHSPSRSAARRGRTPAWSRDHGAVGAV